jgi:anaerobic selenocysteine-containing dehydrogenase
MAVHTTACPRNCYSTCTLRVEVEDGRLRRVLPHEGNRATPEGACLKGLSYVERVASPDRILHPLRRRGAGDFERISWDEALDGIAGQLRRVRDEHGPQALLYYCGSGTKGLLNSVGPAFFRLYGGYTTTYGDLCWPAGLEATRLTLGDNRHNAPWDLARARLIVLWGKNPAETNIHQVPFVEQALRAGGSLVVIDPRRTQSAERAELLVQPRPGTDGALALAMAHVLFRDGLVDGAFVERHVLGAERYEQSLRGCTPEWAEGVTGVPARYVERLARRIGTEEPVTICAGFGMQRYTNSGQAMRAMLALLALTGNLGRPGAGWVFANLETDLFGSVKDPLAFYPPSEPDGVARVSISTSLLGQEMLATRDPALRMAWVERGNPVTQNPDSSRVLEAFRALEFRVVVEQFLTDTAREADIVLPAKTLFEQTDVIGAYWHSYVQLKRKVLEPPGEVKPESEVFRLLAERLELPRADVEAAIPGPSDAEVEAWLARRLEPWPELSLARLREGPVLAPGHQEVAFADGVFPTPSGRIELWSDEARRRWGIDELPSWSPPVESACRDDAPARYPLQLLTPNTKDRIHSQFGNLRMIRAQADRPRVDLSPVDALARGIRSGDRVRIHNERGSLELEARVDFGLRAGCVSVTNGWWNPEGGAVNYLSTGRETDLGHGAAFHDALVEVERLG